ncbi:hypothetical protein L7F22_021734 [Adiantum nelumboides]|nr:hypothetical protein [Adiantum nelumboides]
MEPQIATSLPTGAFHRSSTHVSLAHDVSSRGHLSSFEEGNILTVTDKSLSYNPSMLKLSKRGWIFSTNEASNGQIGCYFSGSYTGSSDITEDHLLHNSSSVHSFCDELTLSHPKSTLSRTTSSLAFSDGSPSSEVVGSTDGSHLDQLKDFMFDDNDTMDCAFGYLDGWLPDAMELPFAIPSTPQNIAYATNSGNSSGGSTEEGIVLHRKDDLAFTNIDKEHEVMSQTKLDPMKQVNIMQDTAIWERQKKLDGLEEMFIPVKHVHEEERSFNGAIAISGGSQIHLPETPFPAGPVAGNTWQDPLPVQDGLNVDAGAFLFKSNSKRYSKHEGVQRSGVLIESASNFKNHTSDNISHKSHDNIASQTPGPIRYNNTGIQVHQDNSREFGLNPILGSSLGAARSEADYSEICLVHLLIAGAEAVATRNMDLASVILVRLKELVSFSGSTMQRVAAYFSDGLQSRIEGNHVLNRIGCNKSQSDLLAAFQILHEISPYIKFGHFTANQAILEAVEGEKSVHIVDFEVMEGIQWPPFMQALVSRKGGPPQLRITALFRPHAERGLAAVQETGKRLENFASSLNLPFIFNIVRVNNEEEFSVSSIKLVKGEALVVNCMLHLPHMPHRTATSVSSFLHGMRRLSPTVLTLVEEELGCSAMAVVSYFFEALHHYSAICDSLEACLSSETVARMLVERVFLAPRINSTVMFWSGSSAQTELGTDFATYNWCSLVRSVGFKSLPLSFQNLSQARLLLGLYKDGFKLDERSNRLLLGWRAKPLFAASVWN